MNQSAIHLKHRAAARAVEYVDNGMVVGLGDGSTALLAVRHLAELLRTGQLQDILAVACSIHIETEARRAGIPLTTLEDHSILDLTIDGADEVDPNLDLIKGAGGALFREKIVAQASRREIIVIDESKLSPALGTRRAVPVEILPFGWRSQVVYLESLGASVSLRQRQDGNPFTTDQGNLILDCNFGRISDPPTLAAKLIERAGVVEHGLFVGLASDVIVAGNEGIRHLKRTTEMSSPARNGG